MRNNFVEYLEFQKHLLELMVEYSESKSKYNIFAKIELRKRRKKLYNVETNIKFLQKNRRD